MSIKRFLKIEQFYPIRGHSFLPCDRDFAILKRNIKKSDRIFTLKEYAELIIKSSRNNQRFTVVLPTADQVFNFKDWWPIHYKKTMLSLESIGRNVPRNKKQTFKIASFRHFIHVQGHDGVVFAKDFIDGLVTQTFKLRNANRDNIIRLPTKKAYSEKIPINIKKITDLRQLQKYIPHENEMQEFYNSLYNWPTTTCDDLGNHDNE